MRGGGSTSSWGMEVNGPVNAQYNRVFGPEYANVPGNVIIGAQGQNITPATRIPTPAQLSAAQSGGKHKRFAGGVKRNGFSAEPLTNLAEALNQPVFPFPYLSNQQTYRRKRGGKRHTRRHRKH
jgi:hypothetical protein